MSVTRFVPRRGSHKPLATRRLFNARRLFKCKERELSRSLFSLSAPDTSRADVVYWLMRLPCTKEYGTPSSIASA
jgi:hypothetical protein